MSAQPKYSIIIPVHNREKFIERSVRSVLNQSFPNLEVLCVNNGSTDQTWPILERLAKEDQRVRIFDQTNKGRCAARNRGLDEAKGEWICFLDSDDFYYSHHLASFEGQRALKKEALAFASTLVHNHSLTDKNQTNRLSDQWLTLNHFVRTNPISLIQLCLHRSIAAELRFHEEDLPMAEDWLFVRELALKTSIWKFDEKTVEVGEHDGRSMNTMDLERIARYNIKSSELFASRNELDKSMEQKILSEGYLLGAHIFLKAGNRASAKKALSRSLRYPNSWKRYSLTWAILKFLLP